MKKLFLLLLIILFSTNIILSQHTVKVFLLDSATKTPINSVKIANISDITTFYSGYDGSFTVVFQKESIFLKLSHHSYKSKSITISKFDISPKYVYLSKNDFKVNEIIISASKNNETKNSTPYLIKTISNSDNKKNIILSIEDYFQSSSAINIYRPQGIYDNSPIIMSNGMGGIPGRTLFMFEGIPLNKANDGNVNWNMLSASNIERVELINNSVGTIYGNNAMSGAINFISKRPSNSDFQGFISSHIGTNNTYGVEFGIWDKHRRQKGFYYNLNIFAQKSDGYVQTPDTLQNEEIEYLPLFLNEIKAYLLLGYDFDLNNKIEIIYNFYDDKRGLGEKISEKNGNYTEHDSHLFIVKYNGNKEKINWGINLFGQNETYFKNIEDIKNEEYSLIYNNSIQQDAGSNLFFSYKPMHKIQFTSGINLKTGLVNNRNIYQTSTDIIINEGNTYSVEGFLQTKISPLNKNNLHFIIGTNYNISYLKNGKFSIENQTIETEFLSDFADAYNDNSFNNLSFNTGFRYNFAKRIGLWTTFNRGYNSPTLEDMTLNSFTKFGFRLANPNLHSEQLYNTNYGIGYYSKQINLTLNGNYNIGNDFIYFVETNFDDNVRIIQKQNITKVKINNFNVDFNYKLRNFELFANYSYNNSKIITFESNPELVGKNLLYSPHYKANTGLTIQLSKYDFSFTGHYNSKQYTDNENINYIPSFYTFDFKISSLLFKKLELGLGIKNVLDYQYFINNEQLSIGRFMLFNAKYKIMYN